MRLKAIINDKEHEVEIRRTENSLSAFIDGVESSFEVTEPEPGAFLFKTADGVFESHVCRTTKDGPMLVDLNSEEFEIEIFDPKRLRGSSASSETGDGPIKIKSAMPGKVVRVIAEVGKEVKAGDGVVVVEAMKMQNELKSPRDGIVVEILVKEEDRVNSGDVLAVIE